MKILYLSKFRNLSIVFILFFFMWDDSMAQFSLSRFYLSEMTINYNNENNDYLIDVYTAVPDEDPDGADYGNTGITYDETNHYICHAEYHYNITSKIILKDRRNRPVDTIDVTPHVDHIQGITYNPEDETFWVWGVKKGVWPSAWSEDPNNPGFSRCYRYFLFDRDGNLLDQQPTHIVDASPGMIQYDQANNAIWVKANQEKLANMYTLPDWQHIKGYQFGLPWNRKGEGISILPSDSSFILGTSTHIYQFSKEGDYMARFDNPSENNQCEGLVVDPTDYTVWLNADEYLHGLIPGGNRVWHVDPFHTYNKNLFYPRMIKWEHGKTGENLTIENKQLVLNENQTEGSWISPVFNYQGYSPQAPEFNGNAAIEVYYRGSNTPPQTTVNDNFALDFYDANQDNDGWGSTPPSAWTITKPNMPYIQIKLVLKPALIVNELMANYGNEITDENGETDDWLEIYNRSNQEQTLSGKTIYLTQSGANELTWQFPNAPQITLAPGEHLTIWADGQPQQGFSHIGYQLKNHPYIGDLLFNSLYSNISYGHFPDGSEQFRYMLPTPEAANSAANIPPHRLTEIADITFDEDQPSVLLATGVDQNFNDVNNGDELTFSTTALDPGLDSVIISNSFDLTVYPKINFNGQVEVELRATDNSEAFASDTIRLSIVAQNDPPVGLPDFYTIDEEETITTEAPGILYNDSDPENDPIQCFLAQDAQHGAVTLNSDGSFNYIPEYNFFGNDTFYYKVSDNELFSEATAVEITISNVNDTPELNLPQLISFSEDGTLTTNLAPFFIDVDNTFEELQVNWQGNQVIQITQNETEFTFSSAEPNWDGTESVTFSLSDEEFTVWQTVSVTCLPINDAPQINITDNWEVNEDETSQVYDISTYISDVDTPIEDLGLQWQNTDFITILQNGWEIRFTPTQENWAGSETLYFSVSDGQSWVTASSTVTCYPVNDPPEILPHDAVIFDEDQTTTVDFRNYVTDVDNAYEQISIAWYGNDNISIIENNWNLTFTAPPNWNGTEEVLFIFDDGENQVETTINVICQAINDPPVVNFSDNFEFPEDESSQIYDFTQYISDVDNTMGEIGIEWQGNNHITINQNFWDFSFATNQANWFGYEEITFTIDDGENQITKTVTINCQAVNDAPQLNAMTSVNYLEDTGVTYDFSAFVSDVDNPLNELTLSWSGNQNIVVENNFWNITFYSAAANWYGNETVTFLLSDGQETVEQSISINCEAVNDPPEIDFPPNFTFLEDQSNTYNFSEYITDVDNTLDELQFAWSGNSNINITAQGWNVTFESDVENWSGSETIVFSVNDPEAQVYETNTVICTAGNDMPLINLPETFTLNEDEQLTVDFTPYIYDVENNFDLLTLEWDTNPNINITQNGPEITFAPNEANWNGNEYITFTVSDFGFLSSSDQTQVIVSPINDSPVFHQEFPEEESLFIVRDTSRHFVFSFTDIDSQLSKQWFFDNEEVASQTDSIMLQFNEVGLHPVRCVVSDEDYTFERLWNVYVDVTDLTDVEDQLYQNLPNPFATSTIIKFNLVNPENVRLEVYDINGRLIRSLLPEDNRLESGEYYIEWDGLNDSGHRMPPGIYFYKFIAGDTYLIKKAILIR